MTFSKTLLLKGLAGLAAMGSVAGGVGLFYHNKNKKDSSEKANATAVTGVSSQQKEKANSVDDTNGKEVKEDGAATTPKEPEATTPKEPAPTTPKEPAPTTPKEPVATEDNLGFPKTCNFESSGTTCDLDKDQLGKVKFDVKTGKDKVEVSGLTGTNKVKVTVENVTSDATYTKSKKYGFTTDSDDKVTVKNLGGNKEEITLEKGKSFYFKENDQNKLEYVDGIDKLGIPTKCNVEQVKDSSGSQSCDLSEEEFKKIKFSLKTDGSSITVTGLESNKKVTLTISHESDATTYPNNRKYTFKSKEEGSVKITGLKDNDEVEMTKDKGVEFKENGQGKLEYVSDVDKLGIPKICKADEVTSSSTSPKTCQLTKDQMEKIKFEPKESNGSIAVTGLDGTNDKVTLTIEYISNSGYTNNRKYKFKTTNENVKITGTKNSDVTLTKDKDIEFKENGSGKLEFLRSVNSLGIPDDCKEGQECDLYEEDIKKIKFKDFSEVKVEGLDSGKSIKLKVESASDNTTYPKGKKYTFTNKGNKEVKIKNDSKSDGEIKIAATNGTIEFREVNTSGFLERTPTEDDLGVPVACKAKEVKASGNQQSCTLTIEQLKKIKFKELDGGSGDVSVTGLSGSSTITLKIEYSNESSKYPNNRKYTFENTSNTSDVKITQGSKSITIAKSTDSHFKEDGGKLKFVETKLTVDRKAKMTEVNGILGKLGINGLNLEMNDFNNGGVSFKKKATSLDEGALKNVQFKEFNGKPTKITDFTSGERVQVELYFTNDSKYPKNLKFVFKNNSGKDIKMEGANNTSVYIRKANGDEETFKVEDGKLARPASD